MKNLYAAFVVLGSFLLGFPAIAETDLSQWPQLENQYRSELKAQFDQKPIDDWSFDEIQDVAASVAEQVYETRPELVRAKMLSDLNLIPVWQGESFSRYQQKEVLLISELASLLDKEKLPWELFYGKQPEAIAYLMKTMMLTRSMDVKSYGQLSLMSQFIPDRTYRMEGNDTTLVVESFNDQLFVMKFSLSQSGLLTPLEVKWLELKVQSSQS